VALSVAALSFNLWFTKLSCKDFRLVSAGAVALGVPETDGFPGGLSSPLPEPGDFGAAALHAQQIGDTGGAGAGKQRAESVSKGVAGPWRGDGQGLGSPAVLPSRAGSRGSMEPGARVCWCPIPSTALSSLGAETPPVAWMLHHPPLETLCFLLLAPQMEPALPRRQE